MPVLDPILSVHRLCTHNINKFQNVIFHNHNLLYIYVPVSFMCWLDELQTVSTVDYRIELVSCCHKSYM